MNLKIRLLLILFIIALGPELLAQALYSYVDSQGIQVFTNIPPTGVVRELKITGTQRSFEPLDNSVSKFDHYDSIIDKYAQEYSLDPSLIRSVIAAESGFNAKAVSPKGARGLMQLMPATAARLGVRDSFDPEQNIMGGARHLRSLLDSFDHNLILSLAAYNAGENLVQRLGRVPEIRETRDYVQSVTGLYGRTTLDTKSGEETGVPSMFRYLDADGVLHLTNVAPVKN